MSYGLGNWHWYDLILLGLALVIVYPDRVWDWVGERTRKAFKWWHVLCLELITMGVLLGLMTLLMPGEPKLDWWRPVMFISVLSVVRAVRSFVTDFFGLND